MSRARIAVFEGLGRRRTTRSTRRSMGGPLFSNPRMQQYGAPLFSNPRMQGYGYQPEPGIRQMPNGMGYQPEPGIREMPNGMGGGYGRRAYVVPPLYGPSPYGPKTRSGRKAKKLNRKGYRVKKGRNTKAQVRFKKAAKLCARISRNKRKGTYQSCMKKKLKKSSRSRR